MLQGRKLDLRLFLLEGGIVSGVSFCSVKLLLLLHSWMRSRIWRKRCSRNTISQERRASHRLLTSYNRKCGRGCFCHNCRNIGQMKHSISLLFFPPLQFKCCGSHNYSDWKDSVWIQKPENKRLVPDSCCKTPSELCGHRDHPSNIYKVEVEELFISSPWLNVF